MTRKSRDTREANKFTEARRTREARQIREVGRRGRPCGTVNSKFKKR
jgi:hypothetical protein